MKNKLKPSAPVPLVPAGWSPERYIERIEHVIQQFEPYRPDMAQAWRERIEQIRREHASKKPAGW